MGVVPDPIPIKVNRGILKDGQPDMIINPIEPESIWVTLGAYLLLICMILIFIATGVSAWYAYSSWNKTVFDKCQDGNIMGMTSHERRVMRYYECIDGEWVFNGNEKNWDPETRGYLKDDQDHRDRQLPEPFEYRSRTL
jgi:hypothetical protein